MERLLNTVLMTCCSLLLMVTNLQAEDSKPGHLNLIIMDPLAKPLACDCVKGYAQRKYENLGEYLEKELDRPVHVAWGGSLGIALNAKVVDGADLIIGKSSVVKSDAAKAGIDIQPIAYLAGKDGKVTQTGLVVVRANDSAQSVGDLQGYRLFF
ncbi:MAG: PhnD/SsuA/transferrin family substrate-binding protein, partial [Planctomycetaceae bacterium]|nr:PhnD/SsuA/transferrin family substrate-binding protein [Planctomycetaceae bacterium]